MQLATLNNDAVLAVLSQFDNDLVSVVNLSTTCKHFRDLLLAEHDHTTSIWRHNGHVQRKQKETWISAIRRSRTLYNKLQSANAVIFLRYSCLSNMWGLVSKQITIDIMQKKIIFPCSRINCEHQFIIHINKCKSIGTIYIYICCDG